MSTLSRKLQTQKRHRRLRRHLSGSAARPRLAVFRSNSDIYVQVIDDVTATTLAAADSRTFKDGDKSAKAKATGALIAERAKAAGISNVVFDRGGFLYHGRVKALAEGAREGGLEF